MDNMNFSGLVYPTTRLGTYKTSRPNSLTPISKHTFYGISREPETTFIDEYMREAFSNYPGNYDFTSLDGWSRSYYTHDGHMDSILSMQRATIFKKPSDSDMEAVDKYCEEYFSKLPKVESMNFHTDLDKVPFEPTSSAGVGLIGKKGDNGNHLKAINQAFKTIQRAKREGISVVIENSTPDMAFTRTQLTELAQGLKVRNVFGQAFQYILLEGLTAHPLLEMFMNEDTFFFIGKDPRIEVPKLLSRLSDKYPKLMSIDWSRFDTTVEPWEIIDAFNLLEKLLTFPNQSSRDAFEFCKIFFINRKIAAPDNTVYFKECAVPSGSYYTMLIDAIINWRRILYLVKRAYGYIPHDLFTQGDDGVGGFQAQVNPFELSLAIPHGAPWILNPYKCFQGTSGSGVPFLQRELKWGNQARVIDKVEKLAIYPEYMIEDPQISAYRARALWEDCNYESMILGYATLYLETKYGKPTYVPRRHKHYWEILFTSSK